jgi:hypothetical protein
VRVALDPIGLSIATGGSPTVGGVFFDALALRRFAPCGDTMLLLLRRTLHVARREWLSPPPLDTLPPTAGRYHGIDEAPSHPAGLFFGASPESEIQNFWTLTFHPPVGVRT